MQHLVQQRPRRGVDVQRGDLAAQRQRDERVAALRDAPPQPPSLGAEDDDHDRRSSPASCSRAPPARRPRRSSSSRRAAPRARKSARLRARAIRRCSTAPAEARQTAGVTSAARRSQITTPLAPTHSAVRQIAPRFWGSWISSSATISGSGRASSSARGDVRDSRRRTPRRSPDARASRRPARSPRPPRPVRRRPAQPRLARQRLARDDLTERSTRGARAAPP